MTINDLKGIEKVNQIIDSFVNQFGLRSEMGTDFSYYYPINKITWSFFMTEESNKSFEKFVENTFPDINCNTFIWSLLHEIGHHETIDNWTGDEQYIFDSMKEDLEDRLLEEKEFDICTEYYSVPDELEATTWAAEYIRDHEPELRSFWDKFQVAANEFAELNEVNIDECI